MSLTMRDNDIVASFLQIFLKEFSGLTLNKIEANRFNDYTEEWVISSSKPIKVTGFYNTQTYGALAIWMARNYPKEGYPIKWSVDDKGIWSYTEYDAEADDEDMTELKNTILNNIDFLSIKPDAIDVPDRVLSYVFGEVVSPLSERDEITRVQKLIYQPKIDPMRAGRYDDIMTEDVKSIQQKFIDLYTITTIVDGHEVKTAYLPDNFEGFKVTGYVDPWTELIMVGGA